MKLLKVNNVFLSIQGEGSHVGEACYFIRLSGCSETCKFCDTDFSYSSQMSVEEILKHLQPPIRRIIWTGGEPLMQLNDEIVEFFNQQGFKQSVETNGSFSPPTGLDYIAVSPKTVIVKKLHDNFCKEHIGEFRFVIGKDEAGTLYSPPDLENLPPAQHYYVSPLFTGKPNEKLELDTYNLESAIRFVKTDPRWKLSIQQQKIWQIP